MRLRWSLTRLSNSDLSSNILKKLLDYNINKGVFFNLTTLEFHSKVWAATARVHGSKIQSMYFCTAMGTVLLFFTQELLRRFLRLWQFFQNLSKKPNVHLCSNLNLTNNHYIISFSGSQLLWNKLRVTVAGAALFRRAGARREARRKEVGGIEGAPRQPAALSRPPQDNAASRTSLDSGKQPNLEPIQSKLLIFDHPYSVHRTFFDIHRFKLSFLLVSVRLSKMTWM